MNIFDYINAGEMAAYIEQLPSNEIPYMGTQLFPNKRQEGMDISWLKGSQGLPITIQPAEYDTKASLRERTGFGKEKTEMAFFREATRIGERDRQEINKLMGRDLGVAQGIITNIFDDVNNLVAGVEAQAEWMRMQLMQYGKFTVKSTNEHVSYTYDYGRDSALVTTPTELWTDHANSNPINDIVAFADQMEENTGIRPTRLVMNRQTYNDMVASESIRRSLMIGVAGNFQDLRISNTQAQSYIEQEAQVTIAVYSKKIATFKDALGLPRPDYVKALKLIDDGNVVFLPSTILGNTHYGTTPEQSDLNSGVSTAQVQTLSNGPTITTFKEPHPVNVVTVVSAVMAPSFEQIDNVGLLKANG